MIAKLLYVENTLCWPTLNLCMIQEYELSILLRLAFLLGFLAVQTIFLLKECVEVNNSICMQILHIPIILPIDILNVWKILSNTTFHLWSFFIQDQHHKKDALILTSKLKKCISSLKVHVYKMIYPDLLHNVLRVKSIWNTFKKRRAFLNKTWHHLTQVVYLQKIL